MNNRQVFQMAPGRRQHPQKMSSAYLNNNHIGAGGGVFTNGQTDYTQPNSGTYKVNTPTNLGGSSSFAKQLPNGSAGLNGKAISNSRALVHNTQKRGPSAEAACGAENLAAKNRLLPPSGVSATMRSQSFNPEKTHAGGQSSQQPQHGLANNL